MTGKAYNNRCIAEWLHNVTERHWRQSSDPRAPLAHLLMSLCPFKFQNLNFVHQTIFVCCSGLISGLLFYVRCLFAMIFQQRNGITRYFGIMERCPRFLSLELHYLICVSQHVISVQSSKHAYSICSIEHFQECLIFSFPCSTAQVPTTGDSS